MKSSHVLQLFPATKDKNINKLLCNSHEYFKIMSLGCDSLGFGRQESKLQKNLLPSGQPKHRLADSSLKLLCNPEKMG